MLSSSKYNAANSSSSNTITLLRHGWLDKEITNGYIIFAKYSPRFLLLSPTFIRYYHKEVSVSDLDQYSKQLSNGREIKKPSYTEIPLSLLNEQILVTGAHSEVDIIHLEHTGTGKLYRFRACSADLAMQWRMSIITARSKLNPSTKLHFGTNGHQGNEDSSEQEIISTASRWIHHNDLVHEFETLAFSNIDRAKYVADTFFEALGRMSIKDRNIRAKEMGKSLVAWMDEDVSKAREDPISSCKADILIVWMRVALSREFLNSCKFDESGGMIEDDSCSDSSSMTHSTIKSRMRNVKRGSMIMPFRADTTECLFISSIFHASCAKTNTLHFILHSALRCISANSENYIYPKAILVPTVNQVSETPHEDSSSASLQAADEKHSNRNSFSRRSRSFFGMVRNSMNLNRFSNRNTRANSKDSNEPGSRPQSLDGRTFSCNNADGKCGQDAASVVLAELALLTPAELKRLEVRKRLLETAGIIVEKLQDCCTSPYLPLPVVLMIKTMRDLIITDKDNSSRNSMDGDATIPSVEGVSEEESEASRNKRRFEYGTFFTSCSAMLFLRLICRAIISPDDYGVAEKLFPTIFERIGSSNSIEWPSSGFAAMTILSHTLFQDVDGGHSMKNDPVNAYSKRQYMNAIEVQELHNLVTATSHQISMNDASMYLELCHFKKPQTVVRNSLNLRSNLSLMGKYDEMTYQFDWSKPSTRWALAEVAKCMQHIANISCLPKEEMEPFARDSLLRQNIAAGFQHKDSYDTHVFSGLESETVSSQLSIASKIKEVYERLGDLPPGKW